MMRMEENLTPINLNTWASQTVSECLEERVGVNQVHIGTFAPISDRVFWQGNRTVVHWLLFSVGGNFEPWVIAPYGMSPSVYVAVVVMDTSPSGVSE